MKSGSDSPVFEPGTARVRRAPRRLLVEIGAPLLVSLVLVEVVLRMFYGNASFHALFDDAPGDGRCVGLRPSVVVPYTGHRFRVAEVSHDTNEFGYRGTPRPKQKTSEVLRIANIGDSFTYGVGVAREATLSVVMAEALSRDASRTIEVLNFGIPGLNVWEAVDQYRFFAREWSPDVVLYFLFRNDLGPKICDAFPVTKTWWRPLFRSFYFVRVPYMYYMTTTLSGDDSTPAEVLVNELKDGLGAFAEATAEDGARFGVVVLEYPLKGHDPAPVERWMDDHSIPFLDVSDYLLDERNRIPREGHLSVEGNALVARTVTKWLSTVDLLPNE